MTTQTEHNAFSDSRASAAQAAAALHEWGRSQYTDPSDTPPSGIPTGPEVLHIYVVDEPLDLPEADGPVVESNITPAPELETSEQETPTSEQAQVAAPSASPSWNRWVLWLALGACVVLAIANAVLYLPLLFGVATATVTIIPDEQALSTVIHVPLSTSPHPTPGTLGGRTLSTLSLTQARTVPTTGIGHQAAEPGHGQLTFYNAAPQVQTIPAGTLLIGKDGVEVVTDADAIIVAAVFPTEGQVAIPAHAVNVGPAGNIAAQEIYGACCRENVFVQNTAAFSGGQDARTFPMVTAQDVTKAESGLRTSLMQSVEAAFKAELAPPEALITPIPCHESVESSSGIGQEATAVTIQLSETCGDSAYDTQALSVLVTHQLNRQAYHQLGTSYALVGSVTTTILAEKVAASGKLLLTVKGTGTWAYQFSLFQLQHLAQLVAGKSASEATTILLQQPGVSQVELGTSGTLPPYASRIHVLVVEQGM